jgi:hypothetical protein
MGWGGVVIDDRHWEVKAFSKMSDWGLATSFSDQQRAAGLTVQ